MNERERAEWLARAIDNLIQGNHSPEPPEFEDEELESLLRVAKARLRTGSEAAREGAGYEGAIWERLVARLEPRQGAAPETTKELSPDDNVLREAVAARRRMSREVVELAERHRDEVWRRVEERIRERQRPSLKARLASFLWPWAWRAARPPEPAGPPPSRTRLVPAGEPDAESLLRMAVARPSDLRTRATHEADSSQQRLRRRMDADPARRQSPAAGVAARDGGALRPVIAIGVVAAVLLALASPLPVTGLGRHPLVEAADYLAGRL